eukprot:s1111_g2.t1
MSSVGSQASFPVVPPLPTPANAAALTFPAEVQTALEQLATNPLFKTNPACLGDLMLRIAEKSGEAAFQDVVPTPSLKEGDVPAEKPEKPVVPHGVAPVESAADAEPVGSPSGDNTQAYKMFWSKFKRSSSGSMVEKPQGGGPASPTGEVASATPLAPSEPSDVPRGVPEESPRPAPLDVDSSPSPEFFVDNQLGDPTLYPFGPDGPSLEGMDTTPGAEGRPEPDMKTLEVDDTLRDSPEPKGKDDARIVGPATPGHGKDDPPATPVQAAKMQQFVPTCDDVKAALMRKTTLDLMTARSPAPTTPAPSPVREVSAAMGVVPTELKSFTSVVMTLGGVKQDCWVPLSREDAIAAGLVPSDAGESPAGETKVEENASETPGTPMASAPAMASTVATVPPSGKASVDDATGNDNGDGKALKNAYMRFHRSVNSSLAALMGIAASPMHDAPSPQELKMYWCWDSSLEKSSQRVGQMMEITKEADISNAHAAEMMCQSNPLNMMPHSFQTQSLLQTPKASGQPGAKSAPGVPAAKPKPKPKPASNKPPKAKTPVQEAKGDHRKIIFRDGDVSAYWRHWKSHVGVEHPASRLEEHVPIGLFGDDAKYTLAGSKVAYIGKWPTVGPDGEPWKRRKDGEFKHYQPPICSALLLVKPGEYPELRIKAYASRVLLSYLQFMVAQCITERHDAGIAIDPELLLIHGVLTSMCIWFSKVEQANRYLTQQEADDIWDTSLLRLVLLQHFLQPWLANAPSVLILLAEVTLDFSKDFLIARKNNTTVDFPKGSLYMYHPAFPGEAPYPRFRTTTAANPLAFGSKLKHSQLSSSLRCRAEQMKSMEISMFWVSTLILESLLLLRLMMLAYRQRLFPQCCCEKLRKLCRQLRQSWSTPEDATSKAMDQTRLVWTAVCVISMTRLLIQQLLLAFGRKPIRPEFDLQMVFLASVSLVINFRPQLITPNSLDLWYVGTSLLSIASLLPVTQLDVTVYMAYSFRAEIFFAALTKHTWCYVLCTWIPSTLAHMGYTLRLVGDLTHGGGGVMMVYGLFFAGIVCARRLFLYNTQRLSKNGPWCRRGRRSLQGLHGSSSTQDWPRPGRVGMIGLGQLGQAVTGNLLRAGLAPVLYDVKGESIARHLLDQGAVWANSGREVAEQCDVILTGLPRPENVSTAMGLEGTNINPDGILAGLQPNSVWIEHSTTDFENTLKIRAEVEKRGAKAVAAPLTGGMQILKVGKMVSLVGADEETFKRVEPLIALSAPRIVRCGDFGHETVVKILTNMLCAVQDCAMGEVMMIAKKCGVDLKLLFDAMRISSGNSFCWETEFARVMDGSYYPDFTAEMMAKDIELGQGLAKKHGVPMLMHGQVAQIYEMCMARYGKDSGSTIPVKLVEDACQTPLADENLRKVFKDWTYTTEIADGSYVKLSLKSVPTFQLGTASLHQCFHAWKQGTMLLGSKIIHCMAWMCKPSAKTVLRAWFIQCLVKVHKALVRTSVRASITSAVMSAWKLLCFTSSFIRNMQKASADAGYQKDCAEILLTVLREWMAQSKAKTNADIKEQKQAEIEQLSLAAVFSGWKLAAADAKYQKACTETLSTVFNMWAETTKESTADAVSSQQVAKQGWKLVCSASGFLRKVNQAAADAKYQKACTEFLATVFSEWMEMTHEAIVGAKYSQPLARQAKRKGALLAAAFSAWRMLSTELLASRRASCALLGFYHSIAALLDSVDHGFLRLVWCRWAMHADAKLRLAQRSEKATSLLASTLRTGIMGHAFLAWHEATNVAKVKAVASQDVRLDRLRISEHWINALGRATVGDLFLAWRFARWQGVLYDRTIGSAFAAVIRSRHVAMSLVCFTRWRHSLRQRAETQVQDPKVGRAAAYRQGACKAASFLLEPGSNQSKFLAFEGGDPLRYIARLTLTSWKFSVFKSKMHVATDFASTKLRKKSYFCAWKAMAQQLHAVHFLEAQSKPDLRIFLAAWKLGSDNQILRRQLRDGMEIAVACTSAALKQGYALLLQRAWDAWVGQVEGLPATLARHGMCSLPLCTLKASWFREDLQFKRAMLLAWHRAVLVEALPAKLPQCTTALPMMPLKSSWLREDVQLQRAMLFGWHMAVLVSAYASDLRLLQQRLESASSHIFRVTSTQQAEQLEAFLRCLFLCWRVAALQSSQEQHFGSMEKGQEPCYVEATSDSSSSGLSRTSQLVALRQVLNAWHRSCAQGEHALEDERSFMLRELNRLQEESRHRAIDMLDVMALSREAVALTAEGHQPQEASSHDILKKS